MHKNKIFGLLDRKMQNLPYRGVVSDITSQERDFLRRYKEKREGIFLCETRDIKKISRLIILIGALNESKFPFQIEHYELFGSVKNSYNDFRNVISSDNLKTMIDSYNIFVDREMHLKPFDDSYIALRRDVDTIEDLAGENVDTARRLCVVQKKHLDSFYEALENIPFQKDRLVRERYENAMRKLI